MGSSTSKNIATIITNSIAKVSSEIIQNTQLTSDSSQVISVSNVQGDVNISGNTFSQTASLNMTALFDALSEGENQQKIVYDVVQNAKSLVKDLNIAQFADSEDMLSTIANATSSIVSQISQTCQIFTTQNQNITVDRVVGNLNITNNVEQQVANLFEKCNEKAVSENKIIQNLSERLNQSASSTTAGLSAWAIAGIIAAVLGIPVIGAAVALPRLLNFIFPIMILAGIVFIIVYNTRIKQEMKLTKYSQFIQTDCGVSTYDILQGVTPVEAATICKDDSNCVGFDWKRFIDSDEPFAQMYKKIVPEQCPIKQNTKDILIKPKLGQGNAEPTLSTVEGTLGDVYLNQKNGIWYQRTDTWPTGWQPMGQFVNDQFPSISWGILDPVDEEVDPTVVQDNSVGLIVDGTVYIKTTPTIDRYDVYIYKNRKWNLQRTIKGPGVYYSTKPDTEISGLKTTVKPTWMLYAGLACLLIGIVGLFIYRFTSKNVEKV